ncbi:MAG: two-component regulator propeller domain-containing protein [Prolixibacteraceae bacterium]
MKTKNRFDIFKLKGKLGNIRDWMNDKHFPPTVLFLLMGIISTIWFLIRVIPKPSRAGYPCIQVAAPFMSGFVIYLLSLGGLTIGLRKARQNILNARYIAAGSFMLVALVGLVISLTPNSLNSFAGGLNVTGPDDGPNQPMGKGMGVNPGRVIWVWDPKATNADCINAFDLYKPENTSQSVVNRMVVDGVKKLSGKTNLHESWDALFRNFNLQKGKTDKPYTPGEKIFIKINQGTANVKLSEKERNSGFFIPKKLTESQDAKKGYAGTCETYPDVVLEILRELVHVVGVEQKNISIGDPISHIFGHNYEAWATEFPEVVYVDKSSSDFGRTLISPTSKDLVFYSDKTQSDKLYNIIENADYMINVANLKPHGRAGVSLTAKNHFGSHSRNSAFHLHYSLISPVSLGIPSNNGYKKYRVLVDLMGSRYLGKNTLLYVVDGLYGGGSNETKVPVRYFMAPFNNDWCNSIFLSQDQVALESVCYDFLRTEWNGTYSHSAANNAYESIPNVNGVDDYLHQAADPVNWPDDIVYDPDNSGTPLASLGVHEHWNNSSKKQYSRNLGLSKGIELLSIPDTLIGRKSAVWSSIQNVYKKEELKENTVNKSKSAEVKSKSYSLDKSNIKGFSKPSVVDRSFNGAFQAKNFYSMTIDDDNTKWFLTDVGIVSFNGEIWNLHNLNRKIPTQKMNHFVYDFSTFGKELWIASSLGATVASLPVDAGSGATTYSSKNAAILSNNVLSIAVGKGSLHWFGTDKGISAFQNKKWLSKDYEEKYPEFMFGDFPIKAMATSPDGDSLYVATEGAGVTRVFRNVVDAISGASKYVQWGTIEIPSDKVYSICVTADGTQWFGTDKGVARHVGYKTLENWTVFNAANGLVNNFVQAVAVDHKGNVWFGTKGGVTVYDNSSMRSFTEKDGLTSNNILCISVDKAGVVWMGTDSGITSFADHKFTRYKK